MRRPPRFIKAQSDYPRVHLTLGMTFSWAGSILQRLIRALGNEPLRLLVASGHLDPQAVADGCEGGAARVLVRSTVPHLEVLPGMDALICHGGASTLMKALYFGVPVLVIPLGAEQRSNGARLVHAGIGKMILPAALSPSGIRNAVRTLLDPARGFRQRAQEMGEKARGAGARPSRPHCWRRLASKERDRERARSYHAGTAGDGREGGGGHRLLPGDRAGRGPGLWGPGG